MATNTQIKMAATSEVPTTSNTTTATTTTTGTHTTGTHTTGLKVINEGLLERTTIKDTPTVTTIRTIKPVPVPVPAGENKKTNDEEPPAPKRPALEQRYEEFLKLVNEIGKDVKPAYTNSKTHGDRLKRNITTARGVLRECLGELDRISRSQETGIGKSNSPSLKA